jgi:hypothetical protein
LGKTGLPHFDVFWLYLSPHLALVVNTYSKQWLCSVNVWGANTIIFEWIEINKTYLNVNFVSKFGPQLYLMFMIAGN